MKQTVDEYYKLEGYGEDCIMNADELIKLKQKLRDTWEHVWAEF